MPKNTNAWPLKPLSEVVDFNPRLDKSAYGDDLKVSFVPMAAVDAGSGRIDVSQTKSFSKVKKGYTPFQENDVLFAKITPCMENGKMAVVPKLSNGLGFGSTEFHVLRPHEGINSRYIYYFVSSQSFRREAAHRMTGAVGQKRVPLPFLEEILLPVPVLDDQKRTVAEIEKQFSRLDEAVANLKRIKVNLKRYKAAVLKAAVEGKLTEEWRKAHPDVEPSSKLLARILLERRAKWKGKGKYKEPGKPGVSNLPELPQHWVWCLTDALFSFVTSGSRGWAEYYSEDGPLFLRMGNLDHESIRLDLDDIQQVKPPAGTEGIRTKVETGDILISITADVGMVAVVPASLGDAYINQHVSLARPLNGFCSEYLAWYLASHDGGQKMFLQLQRGATKVGLGLDDIRAVPVPFPPLAEQQEILAEVERRLSVIEGLESTLKANLTRANCLRQATLKKAFAGKLPR